MPFADFCNLIGTRRLLFLMLLFFGSWFLHYYWTGPTIGRWFFTLILGGVSAIVSAAACFVASLILFKVCKNLKWSRTSKTLVAVSPFIVLSLWLLLGGFYFSRPSYLLNEKFNLPPSISIQSATHNGSLGVDGSLMIITCRISRVDLENLIRDENFKSMEEDRGEPYWRRRFATRAGAEWKLTKSYKVYVQNQSGVQKLIFVDDVGRFVHFVHCTYSHGL